MVAISVGQVETARGLTNMGGSSDTGASPHGCESGSSRFEVGRLHLPRDRHKQSSWACHLPRRPASLRQQSLFPRTGLGLFCTVELDQETRASLREVQLRTTTALADGTLMPISECPDPIAGGNAPRA